MIVVAHVTHEAVRKIGGIGTVLEGLLTAEPYNREVGRSLLVGPLFERFGAPQGRLGPEGHVRYSSLDGFDEDRWRERLDPVCREYGVGIVYGTRKLYDMWSGRAVEVETLLVDVSHVNRKPLDVFKFQLHEQFGIDSSRYEQIWDYEQYVRLGPPALAALRALVDLGDDDRLVVQGHEFMGEPTALCAVLAKDPRFAGIFHAHEVATVRRIVEEYAGHDIMFYNVLEAAAREKLYLEDIFASQAGFFKHGLVSAAHHCDGVFAVGAFVRDELHFLSADFARCDVDVVPNGIPAVELTPEECHRSRELLLTYAERLVGWRPTYVLSHVARQVLSKAFWRDVHVLDALDGRLFEAGAPAVFFLVTTEGAVRGEQDVQRMESRYQWPWNHRVGYPDLTGSEIGLNEFVQDFNRRSRATKIILVNQFGWKTARCGRAMPEEMGFPDLRKGSDLEFGQSIYEPFGISQFEPLTFGAVCVPSSVCGCVPFALQQHGAGTPENIVVADHVHVLDQPRNPRELVDMKREEVDRLSLPVSRRVADEVFAKLRERTGESRERLANGYGLARRMSWDTVSADFFLPAVRRACERAEQRARG